MGIQKEKKEKKKKKRLRLRLRLRLLKLQASSSQASLYYMVMGIGKDKDKGKDAFAGVESFKQTHSCNVLCATDNFVIIGGKKLHIYSKSTWKHVEAHETPHPVSALYVYFHIKNKVTSFSYFKRKI